uniref:Toxin candidate TRINITY_DN32304_c4_g16_i2 n=1 Tax=Pachycerianthus borealis TaxID=2736680 RepID=A0A7G7WZ01_9CNID|nr:toxin candidate TRINITY_DN32304_c4_g16_i2 [Pachycerianthus borealis]QNH72555.1 toxin candidate TRINITY_DN32304_c4_g16_i2 [Pachycerianthus borealis]
MWSRILILVFWFSSVILCNCIVSSLSSNPHCRLNCLPVYQPVCASDGITYDNLCRVGKSNCAKSGTSDPRIRVLHDGHCTKDSLPTKKTKCLRVNRKKFLFC